MFFLKGCSVYYVRMECSAARVKKSVSSYHSKPGEKENVGWTSSASSGDGQIVDREMQNAIFPCKRFVQICMKKFC